MSQTENLDQIREEYKKAPRYSAGNTHEAYIVRTFYTKTRSKLGVNYWTPEEVEKGFRIENGLRVEIIAPLCIKSDPIDYYLETMKKIESADLQTLIKMNVVIQSPSVAWPKTQRELLVAAIDKRLADMQDDVINDKDLIYSSITPDECIIGIKLPMPDIFTIHLDAKDNTILLTKSDVQRFIDKLQKAIA